MDAQGTASPRAEGCQVSRRLGGHDLPETPGLDRLKQPAHSPGVDPCRLSTVGCRLFLQYPVRPVLRLLDIRLIEGIDAEKLSRHRRGELPAEHLRAEIARVFHFEGRGRVP